MVGGGKKEREGSGRTEADIGSQGGIEDMGRRRGV
jgi:hypothetical protein